MVTSCFYIVLLIVKNNIVINAMISSIGFNSGVAMLAVQNKTYICLNGIVTIYLKLLPDY